MATTVKHIVSSLVLFLAFISSTSAQTDTCSQYKTRIPGNTLGWITSGTDTPIIPTPIYQACYGGQCYVFCSSIDSSCLRTASSILTTCTPQWSAYECSSRSYYSASVTGSYTTVTSFTAISTSANPNYPRTVPSNQTFTFASRGYTRVFQPVYVFGNTTVQTSYSTYVSTVVFFTYPSQYLTGLYPVHTPICSVTAVSWFDCPCWVTARESAQVYYWPDQTPGPNGAFPTVPANPAVSVVDGITMTSPSVYIRFPTLYATDGCSRTYGRNRTNVVVSLRPSDVSSVYGGGIPSLYNFGDLGPTVNAAAYERQITCFGSGNSGCDTIYPWYAPPISIPTQVNGADPAWATCTPLYGGAPASPAISIRPLVTGPGTTTTTSRITTSSTLSRSTITRPRPCSTPSAATPTPTRT